MFRDFSHFSHANVNTVFGNSCYCSKSSSSQSLICLCEVKLMVTLEQTTKPQGGVDV